MAATIKPIEAKSVHQIQSGQVIVDLCSVVKELVENALDADASTIEVRFKNYGLDSIEVQDNGTGVAEANYESLALKHYTSKLSTYEDLSELDTFGFRGEALSSLCALSSFSVTTAQAHEAPKGKKLDFEISGKLKSTTTIAAQKGTTVTVENLFNKLPVRQKELSKNIKREYGKVLSLLQAYACISTNVKFTVKNAASKGRSAVVFSTRGNSTTRDNIANVYGAKMLPQLIELDLVLNFQSTLTQTGRGDADRAEVSIVGHISKPVFGEGRQIPDRQMFFVNGRPCGLDQIRKAINEVYKSYNVSQSPFIFANLCMDTNSYDVNVSPDKRTIFLHNAAPLTDRLKEELTKRFDGIQQTVPQSQIAPTKLPSFRQLTVSRHSSKDESIGDSPTPGDSNLPAIAVQNGKATDASSDEEDHEAPSTPENLLRSHFANLASTREEDQHPSKAGNSAKLERAKAKHAEKIVEAMAKHNRSAAGNDEYDDLQDLAMSRTGHQADEAESAVDVHVRDFNARMQSQQERRRVDEAPLRIASPKPSIQDRIQEVGVVQNAFDKMRPRRMSPEIATITIGDKVITRMVGAPKNDARSKADKDKFAIKPFSQFSQSLQKYDMDKEDGEREARNGKDRGLDEDQNDDGGAAQSLSTDANDISEHITACDIFRTPLRPALSSDSDDRVNTFTDETRSELVEKKRVMDDNADRTQEEYRVAELIRMAETTKYANSKDRQRRTAQALKGGSKDATFDTVAVVDQFLGDIVEQAAALKMRILASKEQEHNNISDRTPAARDEEERLSLTISKPDFVKMHIAGQFNRGFIIALRHKSFTDETRQKDELFIIDQHASDEKYNFERLQAETVVGNQRLVHPVLLDLTAVEEEIVLENAEALQQNGFIIDADTSGNSPVGQRCRLLSLPLSREVTFNTKDLEELIHLLSELHISADSTYIPRPGKVRKMFAMRACRSSIMIGKVLSMRQMTSVLEHMGRIDKPWNCPHGRPTMRHLISLDDLEERLWNEGDSLVSDKPEASSKSDIDIWKQYAT